MTFEMKTQKCVVLWLAEDGYWMEPNALTRVELVGLLEVAAIDARRDVLNGLYERDQETRELKEPEWEVPS